jgi:RimJ/RimL family protein N-acetyltransferase
MVEISEQQRIKVKTTLPLAEFPPIEARSELKTGRLILRPFRQADVEALHELRLQPEVMVWTMQGRPDKDLAETQNSLDLRLAPKDTANFDWAICVAATGQVIGIGGCCHLSGDLGWPVLGYMLRKEAWGQGYGTEFVRGFLKLWWALPRREAEAEVDLHTVGGRGGALHGPESEPEPEQLNAVTVDHNPASQNILRKCGMTLVKKWVEEDVHEPSGSVLLHAYSITRPSLRIGAAE